MARRWWKNQLISLVMKASQEIFLGFLKMKVKLNLILFSAQVNGETYKNNNNKRINTRVESKTIRALIVDSFPRGNIDF